MPENLDGSFDSSSFSSTGSGMLLLRSDIPPEGVPPGSPVELWDPWHPGFILDPSAYVAKPSSPCKAP